MPFPLGGDAPSPPFLVRGGSGGTFCGPLGGNSGFSDGVMFGFASSCCNVVKGCCCCGDFSRTGVVLRCCDWLKIDGDEADDVISGGGGLLLMF